MLSNTIPLSPATEEIPVAPQAATVDNAEAQRCLDWVLAYPKVQKAIAESGSYTRNSITSILKGRLGKEAVDPQVVANGDFICKYLQSKNVTIGTTVGKPAATEEERKTRKCLYAKRRRAQMLRKQAETNPSLSPNDVQEQADPVPDLVCVDGFPQDLVDLLQQKFTIVLRHPNIQGSLKEQEIARFRIGNIVRDALREGHLFHPGASAILIHNVMLVCRKTDCTITIGGDREIRDLTAQIAEHRQSLIDWYSQTTAYAGRQSFPDHSEAASDAKDPDEAGIVGESEFDDDPVFTLEESEGELAYYRSIGIDPIKPTAARPGSEEKVLMLSARYSAGLPLWHDRDCYEHGPAESELMGFDPAIERPAVENDNTSDEEDDEKNGINLAGEGKIDVPLEDETLADLAV